jgi:hypothetical protein
MSKNSYQGYIAALRSREAQPAFSRVAALVERGPVRSSARFVPAAVVLLLGTTAAVLWMVAGHPAREDGLNGLHGRDGRNGLHGRDGQQGVETPIVPSKPRAHAALAEPVSPAHLGFLRPFSPSSPLSPSDSSPVLHACAVAALAPATAALSKDIPRDQPISLPEQTEADASHFFAFLGGALSQQFSSDALLRQLSLTDAYAGIGYTLSEHIALRLLGGEEVFAFSSVTQSISYRDTIFVHEGQAYHNVIGELRTTPTATNQRVDWLGGSVQYSFGEGVRPLAEITIAGSTNGLLTRQSCGVELTITDKLDLAILAQLSELLPQGGAWLTKAEVSAALSFRLW